MASSTEIASQGNLHMSLAQELAHRHLNVTVEDDLEDDSSASIKPVETEPLHVETGSPPTWTQPSSSKASAKQPHAKACTTLDTQSHDLFPELGPSKSQAYAGSLKPTWTAKNSLPKTNGSTPADRTSGATTNTNKAHSSAGSPQGPVPMLIPGRNIESVILEPQFILPRNQLKRPIPDLLKELNRKSRATLTMTPMSNGQTKFEASGPQDIAQQALKDLIHQIGVKKTVKVSIPQSARSFLIGRGGSKIKALQERTGAKIYLPKTQDSAGHDNHSGDDDDMIDVIVEGNALSAASAQNEILKIANERSANVQSNIKGIPAEFYPFIAGPKNGLQRSIEEAYGILMRVPPYQVQSKQKAPSLRSPGERPVFEAEANDNHIQLAGDRNSVQRARAEIDRRVEELHQQLDLQQLSIPRGRHQFIIGDRGIPFDEYFQETGCAILLPGDDDDEIVTIIGPPEQVNVGIEKAMDLAINMQCSNIDIARFHRSAPGGAPIHARNVTRYLRHRKEIERLEQAYSTHINTPFVQEGALPWELYSRDGKNGIRAQSEISGIISGHPPERFATVDVDPFFFQHLRNDVSARVEHMFGVQVVVPDQSELHLPVLLVYEGPSIQEGRYVLPRTPPTSEDIAAIKRGLEEAHNHVISHLNEQERITLFSADVPYKYHEKLKKFIKKEQENRSVDRIPIRVTAAGTNVTLRGPESAVELLATKVTAFIEQEQRDEKERDLVTTFDFPQKFANHFVGKAGSHIKELMDRFDVEIRLQDGKVELKGPKAKADAAKSHIQSWARNMADETTHVLKIDPQFHGELIGTQGSQIIRLQTRYKVQISFPRLSKNASDDQSNADSTSEAGKPRRGQAPDEVIIRGPKKGSDEARDELFSLYQYIQENSFTATVALQRKHLPMLIGQGGMALEDLRQETGARIEIPNSRESDLVEIQIKGTKTQVAAAKKIIEEKKAISMDTITKEIVIDKKYHKALIGVNGSALKELVVGAGGSNDRREISRTVQIPKADSDDNIIKVEGRTDVVERIVAKITELVTERKSQIEEVLDVPTEKHGMLIGRGGEIKRQLESQFAVGLEIPRLGDGRTGIKLIGRPEDVEKAKAHIAGMVREQQSVTIQVPRRVHHMIMTSGQTIRKLRNECHVSVDHAGQTIPPAPERTNGSHLPLITDESVAAVGAHSWQLVNITTSEEGDIPWVLRGSAENLEEAKKIVQSAIDHAEESSCVGYLSLPDTRSYRLVVGPSGSKVKAIRQQTGCAISVPRDHAKIDAIQVTGTREGVEKARDLILAAVQEGPTNQWDE